MGIGVSFTGHDGRKRRLDVNGAPAPGSPLDRMLGRAEAPPPLVPKLMEPKLVPPQPKKQTLEQMDPEKATVRVGPPPGCNDKDADTSERSFPDKTGWRLPHLTRVYIEYDQHSKTMTMFEYQVEERKTPGGRTVGISPESRRVVGSWPTDGGLDIRAAEGSGIVLREPTEDELEDLELEDGSNVRMIDLDGRDPEGEDEFAVHKINLPGDDGEGDEQTEVKFLGTEDIDLSDLVDIEADPDRYVEVDDKTIYASVRQDEETGTTLVGLTEQATDDEDGDWYCNRISNEDEDFPEISNDISNDGAEVEMGGGAGDGPDGNVISRWPCKKNDDAGGNDL